VNVADMRTPGASPGLQLDRHAARRQQGDLFAEPRLYPAAPYGSFASRDTYYVMPMNRFIGASTTNG
jgi:hypothetical protein